MSTTTYRAVKVQLHTPVEGQSYKSVSWHWRVEITPGAYLKGEDGKPLEFDTCEAAELVTRQAAVVIDRTVHAYAENAFAVTDLRPGYSPEHPRATFDMLLAAGRALAAASLLEDGAEREARP